MSDATTHHLKVSREGVVLIRSFEGFRPRAVQDEDGDWVIGYGHRASARDGLTVSQEDAELLLQYDLLPVVKALNERVAAPLNQHQFDALASFALSVGVDRFMASDVLNRLNEGRPGEAADALIDSADSGASDLHLRRRAAERALFVADPARPMDLAELLAAPLPPPPVEPAPEPAPSEPALDPFPMQAGASTTPVHAHRYAPYAMPDIGPLPGFPFVTAANGPEGETESATEAASWPELQPEPSKPAAARPATAAPSAPVTPLVPPEPGASPFPPMHEPLVLAPANEADFAEMTRPVWNQEDRTAQTAAEVELVLFDDEPTLPVLRHEIEPVVQRRFDWGETGAFLIMGLIGLAACAFSAASFRKAMAEDSFLGDFTLIGWVLAFIGAACVGVSSWCLYRRWARRD